MKVRFQADADFNHLIVKAALRREPSIDFQSAVQGGLPDLDDRNVLARSAQMGRVLVSHDYKTMPQHFAEFITTQTSSGVVMVSQKLVISRVVEDLLLIWVASDADEWINRILTLPL